MDEKKTVVKKVNDYYTQLKTARLVKQEYNDKLLSANEEYCALTSQIEFYNLKITKSEYLGDGKAEKLRTEKQSLEEKRNEMLKGIKLKDMSYECPICNDTGSYKNKKCKCYANLMVKYLLEVLETPPVPPAKFTDFIPSEDLKKQYSVVKSYAKNFPNYKISNLILSGYVGTGKSHLAKSVYHTVIKQGFSAVYLTAIDLNSIFYKIRWNQVDKDFVFKVLTECDLLIIDDLGTESIYKNITVSSLFNVISKRLDFDKKFIITTNLTNKEILERYNERLLSRLADKSKTLFIPFFTEDYRLK